MDRFEGRCSLDWWANSSTLLGSVAVTVVITSAGAGWAARGHLVDDSAEDREGFAFLCDLDPVFLLRFEDESSVAVTVHPDDGHRNFTLTSTAVQVEPRFGYARTGRGPRGARANKGGTGSAAWIAATTWVSCG
jgi:hypothetical protein